MIDKLGICNNTSTEAHPPRAYPALHQSSRALSLKPTLKLDPPVERCHITTSVPTRLPVFLFSCIFNFHRERENSTPPRAYGSRNRSNQHCSADEHAEARHFGALLECFCVACEKKPALSTMPTPFLSVPVTLRHFPTAPLLFPLQERSAQRKHDDESGAQTCGMPFAFVSLSIFSLVSQRFPSPSLLLRHDAGVIVNKMRMFGAWLAKG